MDDPRDPVNGHNKPPAGESMSASMHPGFDEEDDAYGEVRSGLLAEGADSPAQHRRAAAAVPGTPSSRRLLLFEIRKRIELGRAFIGMSSSCSSCCGMDVISLKIIIIGWFSRVTEAARSLFLSSCPFRKGALSAPTFRERMRSRAISVGATVRKFTSKHVLTHKSMRVSQKEKAD